MTTLPAQAELLARIRHIWESARTQAARSVNTAHVCANWLIGQQIVEAEQGGAKREPCPTRCEPERFACFQAEMSPKT